MKKQLLFLVVALCWTSAVPRAYSDSLQINGPDMNIVDNNIIVDLSISNVPVLEDTIQSGIGKEIIFTVELLRDWRFWPDEFIVSKRVVKSIKYDNLRDQYLSSSYDGIDRTEEHFKDFNSVKDRIFNVKAVNLANVRELEPGRYYIRIVVESKSLEQLPLVGFVMHFIPEVEMSLAKESGSFTVGEDR